MINEYSLKTNTFIAHNTHISYTNLYPYNVPLFIFKHDSNFLLELKYLIRTYAQYYHRI